MFKRKGQVYVSWTCHLVKPITEIENFYPFKCGYENINCYVFGTFHPLLLEISLSRMKFVLVLKTNWNVQCEGNILEMLKYQIWYPVLWNLQRFRKTTAKDLCLLPLLLYAFNGDFSPLRYFWVSLLSERISVLFKQMEFCLQSKIWKCRIELKARKTKFLSWTLGQCVSI